MSNPVSQAYNQAFQVSPIILVGGIVANAQGGALPITSFLPTPTTPDDVILFVPLPGGTLVNNTVGMYPFANQQVAANAIIEQPLTISYVMIAPVRDPGGYTTKTAILTSLATSLQNHNAAGGLYNCATPAYLYNNCIMTGMTEVPGGETKQQQTRWQLDFIQPIVTQAAAAAAQSKLMSKLTAGSQVNNPTWTNPQ